MNYIKVFFVQLLVGYVLVGYTASVFLSSAHAQKEADRNAALDTNSPCPPPDYPAGFKTNKESGTVIVRFLIAADGSIQNTKIKESSGDAVLDQLILASYKKCKFKPAIIEGKPDIDWMALSVDWSIPKTNEAVAQAPASASAPKPVETAAGPTRGASIDSSKTCNSPKPPSEKDGYMLKGVTTMSLLISVDGKVKDSKIIKSSGTAKLDDIALTAHVRCTYTPALVNGKPTEMWNTLEYRWGK